MADEVVAVEVIALDVQKSLEEFAVLKTENQQRNVDYYLNRQAVQGNFRWPRDWPNHIPKVKHNYCKPIVERFSTYLMGRGFSYNVDRPNTLEFRDQAERTEKILRRLLKVSKADILFMEGARTGSTLGRTVFKVYKTGQPGKQHACFQHVQPDYFYGIPATDSPAGEYAKVFFSYPIDISEATRLFGARPYKTEQSASQNTRYDPLPEEQRTLSSELRGSRRVPVLEVWTREAYLLYVGEEVVFNGPNPFKWEASGEGFIPFVVIENIRNQGQTTGESDVVQIRDLNEQMNYLLSRKQHVVGRWLQPTLVWEGAPQNYLEILTSTIGGGGAIPARLGSRLYFLAYDKPNPAVSELENSLRTAILETAGLNEIAYQGTVHGYVNTGPSVNAQYQPVTGLVQHRQNVWEHGLALLFAMLLQLQEDIGDSEVLGLTVVNSSVNSKNGSDGDIVTLSGVDIAGLRDVDIDWPGLLPKDDVAAAQLEMQKMSQGMQSIYTTLEKLGEDYPDDEIARIRQENSDPSLKGQQVAEQTAANAAMTTAQARMTAAQPTDPNAPPAPPPGPPDLYGGASDAANDTDVNAEQSLVHQSSVGNKLRELARNAHAHAHAHSQLDTSGDEPVVGSY